MSQQESRLVLSVSGMSCGHCVGRVEAALTNVAGVESVEVDLPSKSASVTFGDTRPSETDMVNALSRLGYTATMG